MVNDYILSQLVNETEKEVFKSMRDMRADMTTAKALLNEELNNSEELNLILSKQEKESLKYCRWNYIYYTKVDYKIKI